MASTISSETCSQALNCKKGCFSPLAIQSGSFTLNQETYEIEPEVMTSVTSLDDLTLSTMHRKEKPSKHIVYKASNPERMKFRAKESGTKLRMMRARSMSIQGHVVFQERPTARSCR